MKKILPENNIFGNIDTMENLRHKYSYKERLELSKTVTVLRHYLVPILLERQGGVCNRCKKAHAKYDVDHLVYNTLATVDELQLLCVACHKAITDFRPMRNR